MTENAFLDRTDRCIKKEWCYQAAC